MALPNNAPTVPCTLSKPLLAEGTVGTISSAYLQIDRILVWAATGETIYGDSAPIKPGNDGTLAFNVIPVDAEGVLDAAGNMVQDWSYSLRVSLTLANNSPKTVTYAFQPRTGQTIDLDLQPQVGVISNPPATTDGSKVTINITNVEDDVIDGGVLS